jgi:tripartite-type tricarboxylate transporter receptor subunit TctC
MIARWPFAAIAVASALSPALRVPAHTPAAVIEKLHADTAGVLGRPDVLQKLENLGSTVLGSPPQAFALRLKAEMAKWGPIIRDAHITIDD